MDMIQLLQQELQIQYKQAAAAVQLIDEGYTIPFIARYRKEVTGSLNDEVLRALDERLRYLRNLEERRVQVTEAIRAQEKLTPQLERKLQEAMTLVTLEDLYRPYRPKRRTRAMVAKERGLEPLAEQIWKQETKVPVEELAESYLSDEVPSVKEAVAGAMDILAERISDQADYRARIRSMTVERGFLSSQAKEPSAVSVYEMYYQYQEPISKCAGHRVLALNRGEKEQILTVKLEAPTDRILEYLKNKVVKRSNSVTAPVLELVVEDSYKRLIAPAIEREIRAELTEKAQEDAIRIFGRNLQQLLMQPPISGRVVLGWDPAFRTGCKLAVVDATGKVLDTAVIYPTQPYEKIEESKAMLKHLIEKYGVSLIALGNGTASRESEQIIAEFLKEISQSVQYVIVSEAGASIYSASRLAAEELPHFDVGQRSAASIARRLQDPLAELVKIDPRSIGVGQYQHDMDQKRLSQALCAVVEDCVNKVGVDLNTDSVSLLEQVSGIGKTVAKNIVSYREEHGRFTNRKQLLKVAKLGPKAYEQCAGFLRITDGDNPLDATGVHPETYSAAMDLIERLGVQTEELKRGGCREVGKKISDMKRLAEELGIGEITLRDIVRELEKPARDPREEMPRPVLRTDVLRMEDLKPEMILKGTVRNVIDFGAFVDIGVHQDGLVHISQMANHRIRHPIEVVHVGDIVEVKVLSIDLKRERISLTMRL